MRAQEAKRWSNVSATSLPTGDNVPVVAAIPGSFNLSGGMYQLAVKATSYGTVQLQQVGPDGSTLIPVGSAVAANGVSLFTNLPTGAYVLTLATVVGLYAAIARIPTGE